MKTNGIFHSSNVQNVGQSLFETRYRAPWSDRTNNTIIIIKYNICRMWQIRWMGMMPPPGNVLTLHLDFKVEFMLYLFSMKSMIFFNLTAALLYLKTYVTLLQWQCSGIQPSTNLWRPYCSQCVFLSWHAVGWFGRASQSLHPQLQGFSFHKILS